jgi:Ni/Co efflux regulator RcnB
MKRTVTTAVLATLLAGSAAMAGTPPHWLHDQAVATHENNNRSAANDSRDEGRNARAGDRKRQAPRPMQQPRRDPPPAVRSSFPPTAHTDHRPSGHSNPPLVASNGRTNWANDGHGDRKGFNDPRPNTNWQVDHNSGRQRGDDHGRGNDRDDRNWNRDNDSHWNRDRDWHDRYGRDWRRDRGWYDQYRYNHFRRYNDRFFARERFFIGYYYAPRGYGSRVWLVGDFLPFTYFGDRYFLDDFNRFDLYDPPYGCRWVRVGSDALLVDIESGYVLDAISSLFW